MKNTLLALTLTSVAFALTAACGGTATNSNSNMNRANGSTTGNAMNTVANTASDAANAVANTASSMMTASPESFLKDAAEGGIAEVEMGKVAVKNAQSAELKKFGQMMIDDHSKANAELKALAAKKNITVPADAGSYKSDIEDMVKMKGADFDKDYVSSMVDAHESDVEAFEKQANNGSDPDVKAFAAKTLPVLKKHLEAINALQAKMK